MADEVRLHIGLRIFEAVANAGLGSEVHDPIEILFIGKALQGFGVEPRELPLSPPRVWELINAARPAQAAE